MVSVLSLATNDLSLARVRGQTCDHGDHREQLGCKQQSGVKTDKQMVMMMMMSPIQMKRLTPGWWLVLVRKWPGVTLVSTLAGSLPVTWPRPVCHHHHHNHGITTIHGKLHCTLCNLIGSASQYSDRIKCDSMPTSVP